MSITRFIKFFITIIFRTFIWSLITSNFSFVNIVIGLIISTIIPIGKFEKIDLFLLVNQILVTIMIIPQVLKETLDLILIRNPGDYFIEQKSVVSSNGSQFINFIDLLRITITPISLVTKRSDRDSWRVHVIRDKKNN